MNSLGSFTCPLSAMTNKPFRRGALEAPLLLFLKRDDEKRLLLIYAWFLVIYDYYK